MRAATRLRRAAQTPEHGSDHDHTQAACIGLNGGPLTLVEQILGCLSLPIEPPIQICDGSAAILRLRRDAVACGADLVFKVADPYVERFDPLGVGAVLDPADHADAVDGNGCVKDTEVGMPATVGRRPRNGRYGASRLRDAVHQSRSSLPALSGWRVGRLPDSWRIRRRAPRIRPCRCQSWRAGRDW